MIKNRTYFCIDMKSFFASVECAERGLNPLTTDLVVADEARGTGTICLAVSPSMKAKGVKNRCRFFEIPAGLEFITAKPRMQKYIEYAAEIYGVYLDHIHKDDIHVYSIDESFIDATDYLVMYKKTPVEFARFLTDEIARRVHIPATVGIGTNLYLAKIALDITAKTTPGHIAFLDEERFKTALWHHKPLTDFWGISGGTVKRLAKYGITDMAGIAACPEDLLYREFGVNAELLIDHSRGVETCLMSDIKNYKAKSKSVSSSQVLFHDYTFDEARIIVEEMVRSGCLELMRRKLVARSVDLFVGYTKGAHEPYRAHARLGFSSNLPQKIMPAALALYDKADRTQLIRRIGIGFDDVVDAALEGYDLFTDFEALEKQKRVSQTVLELQQKFGRNAVVMASDLKSGATLLERNKMIGGHNADGT